MAKSFFRCSRCGTYIGSKDTKFIVNIHVTMDSSSETEILRSVADEFGTNQVEEIEDWICKEMAFLLCCGCRDYFVMNPLNQREDRHHTLGLIN